MCKKKYNSEIEKKIFVETDNHWTEIKQLYNLDCEKPIFIIILKNGKIELIY